MNASEQIGISELRLKHLRAYNSIWQAIRKESQSRFSFGNTLSPAMYAWPWDIFNHGDWRKFVITLDAEIIGVAALVLDKPNGVCCIELGLLPRYRGKGFGGIAGRLLISKCFIEYSARLVEAFTLSTNLRSIGMHDWMDLECVLKGRHLIQGQEVDELVYKITRSEWEAHTAQQ